VAELFKHKQFFHVGTFVYFLQKLSIFGTELYPVIAPEPWDSRERHKNFLLIIFVFCICAVCFVFKSLSHNEHVIFKLTK